MNLELLEQFFFWWMITNLGFYILTAIMVVAFPKWLAKVQARVLGIDETTARTAVYYFLAAFKLLIIVFNLGPWIALRVIA